jgi:hypothetical protein
VSDLLKKLQYAAEAKALVLHAPAAFAPHLETLREQAAVDLEPQAGVRYGFVMAFVTTLQQVSSIANALHTLLEPGDAKVWMAYPKASSKRHTCEFNRDTGWQAIGDAGLEPVRQIAVDDDWSALRFRRVEFIKSIEARHQPRHQHSRQGPHNKSGCRNLTTTRCMN